MIYLNNAATTKQKPPEVVKAVSGFMNDLNVSPGRGADTESVAADKVLTDCRRALSTLFNAPDPNSIVFTLNCSDALNMAIKGVLKPGDHVIISSIEHNSIGRPLRYLEKQGIEISIVPVSTQHWSLVTGQMNKYLKKNTKLVAMLHASNVVGAILPIGDVGKFAKYNDLLFLVDAAQTAGIYDIDVQRDNIDLLAFAGHKGLMGPMGTGGLYIGNRVQGEGCSRAIIPLRHGGTGSQSESEEQPEMMPDKFETGTPNTPGIAGLLASTEFILKTGTVKIKNHLERLTTLFLEGVQGAGNRVQVYGPKDAKRQSSVISFNIDGMEPAVVGKILEEKYGIIVRTGLHCSPLCHKTIGTFPKGTVRASMGYYNTEDEIKKAVKAIAEIAG